MIVYEVTGSKLPLYLTTVSKRERVTSLGSERGHQSSLAMIPQSSWCDVHREFSHDRRLN